jgi:hypothetical protein
VTNKRLSNLIGSPQNTNNEPIRSMMTLLLKKWLRISQFLLTIIHQTTCQCCICQNMSSYWVIKSNPVLRTGHTLVIYSAMIYQTKEIKREWSRMICLDLSKWCLYLNQSVIFILLSLPLLHVWNYLLYHDALTFR